MLKFLTRTIETAVKLPIAAAWDVISLGNMGDGSSTEKVLREHRSKKRMDDFEDQLDQIKRIFK